VTDTSFLRVWSQPYIQLRHESLGVVIHLRRHREPIMIRLVVVTLRPRERAAADRLRLPLRGELDSLIGASRRPIPTDGPHPHRSRSRRHLSHLWQGSRVTSHDFIHDVLCVTSPRGVITSGPPVTTARTGPVTAVIAGSWPGAAAGPPAAAGTAQWCAHAWQCCRLLWVDDAAGVGRGSILE
jgi:hypothetical protein